MGQLRPGRMLWVWLLLLSLSLSAADETCSLNAEGGRDGSCGDQGVGDATQAAADASAEEARPTAAAAATAGQGQGILAPPNERNPYQQFRFHSLAVPHTITSKEYYACAFTQKVFRFCREMKARGHTVYHYGHEHSTVESTEHITVVTAKVLRETYGDFDFKKAYWKYDYSKDKAYKVFSQKAIAAIRQRCKPGDFVLAWYGYAHKAVLDGIKDSCPGVFLVEPSVGYPVSGVFTEFRVFESYAHQAHYYASVGDNSAFKWNDVVIPSGFDLEDFEFSDKKKDFCLYLSRPAEDKGINIAIQATKAVGCKLVMSGQGGLGHLGYKQLPNHVELVGHSDVEQRRNLMRDAKVLLLPTHYSEPYGFVIIEAMLSGTPVITTDWGAFSETVLHGVTGYRCRTFEQFKWAIQNIHRIKPWAARQWAEQNYVMSRVIDQYEQYFDVLSHLGKQGRNWYYEYEDRQVWDLPARIGVPVHTNFNDTVTMFE